MIEKDNEGYNHLHIGIKGNVDELKLILKHTYENLHLHEYDLNDENIFSKQTNIAIIRCHNAYYNYLNKYSTIKFLIKKNNLEIFIV